MTLKDCYTTLGGDYADAAARLHSDRLVQKFVLKYLEDPSYNQLCAAMAEQNYEEAFRAAHTIKGICQNLSFTQLLSSSSRLSEALRHGYTPRRSPSLPSCRGTSSRWKKPSRLSNRSCRSRINKGKASAEKALAFDFGGRLGRVQKAFRKGFPDL